MNNSHQYAIQIELIMRDAFDSNRFYLGGLVNSDYVEHHPFMVMMCTLTYLYGCNKNGKEVVQNFFETYMEYDNAEILDILGLKSSENNGIAYEVGEEAMQKIIDEFSKACEQLK